MIDREYASVRGIIFDLDGTLIDSSRGVIEATNYALRVIGAPERTDVEIKRFIGHPLEEMFAAFGAGPLDKLNAAFQERGRETITAASHPMPHVSALLPLLAEKYRLAIATTKFRHHTSAIVKKLGWEKVFQVLASGDEVVRVKPAPDLVLLALNRLGLVASEVVMVGDTINDIFAAHAAGVKVIAVKSPFGDDNIELAGPNLVLESFAELIPLFLD